MPISEVSMKRNVGNIDRLIRIVVGIAIIAFGVYYKNWWGAVGIIPIITALIGWCPVYVPFGISTHKE
jgi:sulfite exporter TauE/SafE